jgi:hypothetical protein
VVWDKRAAIEFIKPGRGTVRSVVNISEEELLTIKANTMDGSRYLPEFDLKVVDEQNEVVANIKKTVYIRKKSN